MNADLNTPLWQLTAGDFINFLAGYMQPDKSTEKTVEPRIERYVYGIAGVAKLLGCSKTMVSKYRQAGWIEPAIKQNGRKIICDGPLALELFGKRK